MTEKLFDIEGIRILAYKLYCDDQFRLATFIAANVGYVLVPEPPVDEQIEQETQDARSSLLKELDDIFDNAKEISCTRLSLAIEALIDAKIKK